MLLVLIVGLLLNAVALPLAGRRVLFLYRAISSGQPAPDRIEGVTRRTGAALKRQVIEVFGQKKLLKWSIPGAAHFFVFWAFLILGTVYLEAYAVLISRNPEWHWLFFGTWSVLGFAQDFIAVMCLVGIGTFWWIRIVNNPANQGRKSRFYGSHLGPAYFTLFMIFNVLWTLFLFRGAVEARDMKLGHGDGYGGAAFVSYLLGKVLPDSTVLIGIGLLLHIGVMLAFLIFVLNSKHLHIFVAPLNVMFARPGVALGAAKPMTSGGKPLTLDDLEDLDDDAKLGVGAAEDFSWKGILDMATCTECGRCQSQCPAWNTEKPLSPKLLMMNLRDHTLAKAPYLLADEGKREAMLEGNEALAKEVERPLIGDESMYGVIDPDVLWSCVTCGACVQQCPVDIEHVDHIVDMRRYQVLVESNFPAELNGLFKGMENKGNPWNMSATARMDWAKDLPFEVKVVGEDLESLDEVDWLFWVGCAGAYEDRAKKTTRAVAELLNLAGVSFGVLGNGETCTGDSARRAGNEFVFQGLAAQNIETFKEYKVKKAVTTCAHCFNTLKNEYTQLGIELEVVHHTQLLNRLVREKKLTPVASNGSADKRSITYHDPCYLGRHNQVYSPPRELLQVIPDASFTEMPRNSERSFCCGAGGARMWMEEKIGSRINETRTLEAVGTGADQIAVGCPFCRVMLSDGLTSAQSKGEAREEVEVLDVAQLLLASVKGESKAPAATSSNGAARGASGATAAAGTATIERDDAAEDHQDVATQAEPESGDVTQTEDTVTDTAEVGAAAQASGGSSLFDLGDDADDAEPAKAEPAAASDEGASSGGSLFDLGSDETEPEPEAKPEPEPEPKSEGEPEAKPEPSAGTTSTPASEIPEGGSLFDLAEPEESPVAETSETSEPAGEDPAGDSTTDEPVDRSQDAADTDVAPAADEQAEEKPEPTTSTESTPSATSSGTGITPATEIPEGGSLFDLAEPEEQPTAATAPTAVQEPEPEQKTEPEQKAEAEQKAEPEQQPEPDPADSGGLGGKYPAGQSMFDVPTETASAPAEQPEAQDEPGEQSEQPASDDRPVTSLRDIKAKYADGAQTETPAEPSDEPSDEPSEQAVDAEEPADAEPSETQQVAEESSEPAARAGSGEQHEPKTDQDIGQAGSLFDL